jgi:hypothetical protein
MHKFIYSFFKFKNIYPVLKIVGIVGSVVMIGEYKHTVGQKRNKKCHSR